MEPRHHDLWTDRRVHGPAELADALRPYPAEKMRAYPVSTWVNDVKHKDPRCIEPAA